MSNIDGRKVDNNPVLSIVIPLYCEGQNLKILLSQVYQILENLNISYEIILIDDCSIDNTWALIEEETRKYPTLQGLKLSKNFGKEAALCAGIEHSKGSAVLTLDGDLQHPPEIIPEMVRKWMESDADIVEAVKESRGKESLVNKVGAVLFYTIMNKLSGYDLSNASDFKLMDRKVIDAWLKMGEQSMFYRGMSAWLGFKRVAIPFKVQERISGITGWSFLRLIRLSITAVTSFSSLPLHIITLSGGLFLLFALILGMQTIWGKILGDSVSGFTTVIILQLIIGSILMLSLGIIGEYLAKIFNEVKQRPRYVVAEIIDRREIEDSLLNEIHLEEKYD